MNLFRIFLLISMILWSQTSWSANLKTWGYVAWWLPNGWKTVSLQNIDRLLIFDFPIDKEGRLTQTRGWPENWSELRHASKQKKIPIDLTLSLLDESTFAQVFGSKEAVDRLIQETLALSQDEAVNGIHLDVEIYGQISEPLLQSFRNFVKKLSIALKFLPQPRSLSVFVPAGSEVPIYDSFTLAEIDYVVMQSYDAHWAEGPIAGPIAPLHGESAAAWKNASVNGQKLGLAASNILLSFPLYGYEWPVQEPIVGAKTSGKAISTTFAPQPIDSLPDMQINIQDRIRKYGLLYDPISDSSYYQYTNEFGKIFQGWFEDVRSLEKKVNFLKKENLGGIAFFILGYDNGEIVSKYHSIKKQEKFMEDPSDWSVQKYFSPYRP